MILEEWFIKESELDDYQYDILRVEPDKSFILQGSAGSGKTVLALYRAKRVDTLGTFAFIVYTKSLRNMIEFGLKAQKLSPDRAVYEWSWDNRGFELSGEVYCKGKQVGSVGISGIDRGQLYLSTEKGVECFTACSEERKLYYEALFTGILTNISKLTLEERRAKEVELAKFVTVDFADYVPDSLYSAFGRRVRWFENTGIVNINLDDSSIQPIPSAGLFRKKVPVDYMIVDEVQDFSLLKIADLQKDTLKSISLFGDTVQQLYHDKGVSLDAIEAKTGYNRWQLNYNYRLPKTIAKLAQFVSKTELVDKCRKGDFPNFPLPVIKKCASQEEELDFIIERIQGAEKLEDVGILVPREAHVEQLYNYFNKKGVNTQVKYKKNIGSSPFGGMLYRQIDTLDFASTNPCILTYHSAKGTQFKNVFLPFCENSIEKNPFYVALTRSCYQVYITYKQSLTSLLANVPKEFFRSL
jgi:hypothetical protein